MANPHLGIIGFGSFGRFVARHLRGHFKMFVADARPITAEEGEAAGVKVVTVEEAAAKGVVVLAVPVQCLEDVLKKIARRVVPGAIVIDVSSVKMKPIDLMVRYLPASTRVVGTHPLFGPQSGAKGIAGMPIAVCAVNCDEKSRACVREFLTDSLRLRVIDTTPWDHDRQMAYVQGLTHFIGRAVQEMGIPESELATATYERLLAMQGNIRHDSMELFLTIERENPFAAGVRRAFLDRLEGLENRIAE